MTARIFTIAATLLVIASATAPAQDRAYPTKPIKLIVSSAPGTPTDLVARVLAEKLGLGQPVIVDNRPGGSGTIGMTGVAKAAPDGYTVGILAMSYLTAPVLIPRMPYEAEKELLPVTLLTRDSNLLVVPASSPFRSVKDLVAAAKAKPGTLKVASGGNSSPAHLISELFKRAAGVDVVHIPYKGVVAGVTAVLSGEVDLMFAATAAASPHIKSGRIRALAASTPDRVPGYPDVPTLVELGYADVAMANWFGIVAPAGTPKEIVARWDSELRKVKAMPEVKERLQGLGLETVNAGSEEFAVLMRADSAKWIKVARDAGIKAD